MVFTAMKIEIVTSSALVRIRNCILYFMMVDALGRAEFDSFLRPRSYLMIFVSPHLRAKLGDILFWVFLPSSERAMLGSGRISRRDGAHTALLYSYPGAFSELAPSLLLLYGDVEVRESGGGGGHCWMIGGCPF